MGSDGWYRSPSQLLFVERNRRNCFPIVFARLGRGMRTRWQLFRGNTVGSKQEKKNTVATVDGTAKSISWAHVESPFRNTWGEREGT